MFVWIRDTQVLVVVQMMCLLGSSKMAVMARLLAGGNLSQTIAEEVGHQKLAVQSTYRQLREADEANLLDEQDMDIFGLMPMTDPLHLVCCNACKKPVKASQYAAHAEICRSLTSTGEALDISVGVGHKIPPRKERKRLLISYSNQAKPAGEQEQSESMNADDSAALESQLHRQPRLSSSFSIDTKGNSACVDVTSMMDCKGVCPEITEHSACVMPPPKRIKLVSRQRLLLSDNCETASGLTKTTGTQIPFTNIPVPLATKIYYSQRNNVLRSVVASMYHVASAKGLCCGVASPEASQESLMQVPVPFQRASLDEQVNGLHNKKGEPSASKPNQILAESLEVCLDISGGFLPATNSSISFLLIILLNLKLLQLDCSKVNIGLIILQATQVVNKSKHKLC